MEFLKNLYKQVRSFFARTLNAIDKVTYAAIDEAQGSKDPMKFAKAVVLAIASVVAYAIFGRIVGFVLGTICCGLLGAAGILLALPLAIFFIFDTFAAQRDLRNEEAAVRRASRFATA